MVLVVPWHVCEMNTSSVITREIYIICKRSGVFNKEYLRSDALFSLLSSSSVYQASHEVQECKIIIILFMKAVKGRFLIKNQVNQKHFIHVIIFIALEFPFLN